MYPKGPVGNLVGQYTSGIVDSLSFKRQDNHRKQPLNFTFLMNKKRGWVKVNLLELPMRRNLGSIT